MMFWLLTALLLFGDGASQDAGTTSSGIIKPPNLNNANIIFIDISLSAIDRACVATSESENLQNGRLS